jgi:hypothetical protein
MIDILNVIVYVGGPSVIASLIAYWSVKGGRNSIGQKKELLVAKTREYSKGSV